MCFGGGGYCDIDVVDIVDGGGDVVDCIGVFFCCGVDVGDVLCDVFGGF